MSQSPDSPDRLEGNQPYGSALEEYHRLMAAGHFIPFTSTTMPPTPLLRNHAEKPLAKPSTPAPKTPTVVAYSPPPARKPTASPKAVSSPPRATAPPAITTYTPNALTSTMPRLLSSNVPPDLMSQLTYSSVSCHTPIYQPQPPILESITYDTIVARVQTLLQDKLKNWDIAGIVMLSSGITNFIISLGQKEKLGPYGISSLKDIVLAVGHEGTMTYMALAVKAPVEMRVLLHGQNTNLEGRNPLKDKVAMEWLRQGFHNSAMYEWQILNDAMRSIRR